MDIRRGMRDKLDKYISVDRDFEVCMSADGEDVYDYSCFGVDDKDKLCDDRYMVFYNQEKSPEEEIRYSKNGNTARFLVNMSKLPPEIHKLVFTVNIDGNGTMGTIQS